MMPLKPVDKKKNPGLAKLPTDVRNKMGYMKDGGMTDDMPARLKDGRAMLTDYLDKDARERGMKDKDAAKVNLAVVKAKQEIRKEKNKKKKPIKKASGGMARRDKDEEKALKGIEKQQKSQAKRAEQAHRDVREYVRKKARTKKASGGMVLEIGLRPATKSEMKMAKEMKKPVKKANGGMVRGSGAAIRGNKFKGVF